MRCELCGATSHEKLNVVEIDGAILHVCNNCARFGKKVMPRSSLPVKRDSPALKGSTYNENLVVNENFPILIKSAREKLGLTQQELGRRLGEKASVISKLETGKLKPSIPLARKIENILKIKILEEAPE